MSIVSTETGEIIAACTPDEAREITDRIRQHVTSAWELLVLAHDRAAWRALGYSTFAEYVATEFEMSRRQAYYLLDQGRVVNAIESAAGVQRVARDVSIREAQELKPQLDELQREIRDRVDAGETPELAVRAARDAARPARPKPEATTRRHLSSVETEPDPEPSVADVAVIIPWSFKKEVTPHEPQTARDAAGFFDAKVIKNPDLWHKHLDHFPARLRPAALIEAEQQAAHWHEAVRRLSRTAGPRSA